MSNASGKETACSCCGTDVVVLACSGASNVGHLSDLAARELTRRGVARMGCLAGVAARAPKTLTALQRSQLIVVLDGCAMQCGKRTVIEAGYQNGLFLRTDTLGMKRGETPVNEENVQRLATATAEKISEWCQTVVSNSKSCNSEEG
ncbi:MAG: putative zinc-binding protein [Thermogutta sp.]